MEGHQAAPKTPGAKLRVGYFARIAPEKGLHILCEAVSLMKEPAELRAAGYLPAERRDYLEDLKKRFRVIYEGSPDRDGKIRFLRSVDVLSVPSTYDEPKGLFLFEAMANGTPVVQPRRGAYTEIIERTGGGVLVNPDDPRDLARELDVLARDRGRLDSLAAEASTNVGLHYTIEKMAKRTIKAYETAIDSVTAHAGHAQS
jgi:glycosyltransferase involved in cell wall biosynthesis